MLEIVKPQLIPTLIVCAIAHGGSFLTLWKLPFQKDPYTYRDLLRGHEGNNLTDRRAASHAEFYEVFGEEFAGWQVIK